MTGYNIYYSECPIGHTRYANLVIYGIVEICITIIIIIELLLINNSSALACKCGDEFKLYYEQVETGKDFGLVNYNYVYRPY